MHHYYSLRSLLCSVGRSPTVIFVPGPDNLPHFCHVSTALKFITVSINRDGTHFCSLVTALNMPSSLVSSNVWLLFFRFEGRVVAKLPFVPLGLFQGLSHRGLSGEDYTDCSFIFLYILCTMSIRQVRLPFFRKFRSVVYFKAS